MLGIKWSRSGGESYGHLALFPLNRLGRRPLRVIIGLFSVLLLTSCSRTDYPAVYASTDGEVLNPGLYRAAFTTDHCAWALWEDTQPDGRDKVVASGGGTGHQLVEIGREGGILAADGCGVWVEYYPGPIQESVLEGMWLVGGDIAPGRYLTTGPAPRDIAFGTPTCLWAVTTSLRNTNEIRWESSEGVAEATLDSEEFFLTWGCASWERTS